MQIHKVLTSNSGNSDEQMQEPAYVNSNNFDSCDKDVDISDEDNYSNMNYEFHEM